MTTAPKQTSQLVVATASKQDRALVNMLLQNIGQVVCHSFVFIFAHAGPPSCIAYEPTLAGPAAGLLQMPEASRHIQMSGPNEIRMLHRCVKPTETGLIHEADPRHVDLLSSGFNISKANAGTTPGVKEPDADGK